MLTYDNIKAASEPIALILGIIALPITLILWLWPNSTPIKQRIANLFIHRIDADKIRHLESSGLTIANKELLADDQFARRSHYVYWPVVPTASPNLIHAMFVYFAKQLIEAGLHINLIIFDEYYGAIKRKEKKIATADTKHFVRVLKAMGLPEHRMTIIFESSLRSQRGRKRSWSITQIAASLSLGELKNISSMKQYIGDDAPSLRFLKPILNMKYLAVTSEYYGFTLSGKDEKILWDTYAEKADDARYYKLTNLYIPTMLSIEGKSTNALDWVQNMTTTDSFADLEHKVQRSLSELKEDSGIFYILEYMFFKPGRSVPLKTIAGETRDVTSKQMLLDGLSKSDFGDPKQVAHALAAIAHNILHGNKGEAGK